MICAHQLDKIAHAISVNDCRFAANTKLNTTFTEIILRIG